MSTPIDAPTDTRGRILEAARRRFADQGYEATSLREIAEDLGVTKAALYYHFPSKVDILAELFEPMRELFLGLIDNIAVIAEADHPTEAFAQAIEEMVHHTLGNREMFGVVERNRHVVTDLLVDDLLGENHESHHRTVDNLLNASGLPLQDRIRMTCALGAISGFDDWAPSLFTSTDPAVLEKELIEVTRSILGLGSEPDRG